MKGIHLQYFLLKNGAHDWFFLHLFCFAATNPPPHNPTRRHLGNDFDQRVQLRAGSFATTVDSRFIIACGFWDQSFRVISADTGELHACFSSLSWIPLSAFIIPIRRREQLLLNLCHFDCWICHGWFFFLLFSQISGFPLWSVRNFCKNFAIDFQIWFCYTAKNSKMFRSITHTPLERGNVLEGSFLENKKQKWPEVNVIFAIPFDFTLKK